jgi:glycosyltransferase involved in cell wall biosynthesis
MSAPRISTIMPVRDCERYIGEALDSIVAQTHPCDQTIVVDDGSTDGTVAALAAYGGRVTCIEQEPLGVGAALNAGLELADGELVAFLDADDRWTPRKLEWQCAALGNDPALEMVFGHVEQFVSPELSEKERAQLDVPAGRSPGKAKGTMLIRRAALDRVGPFTTSVKLADFVDWYSRAEEAGVREAMIDEVVLLRRNHLTNHGRRRRDLRQEYAQVLGEALRRRRAGSQKPS